MGDLRFGLQLTVVGMGLVFGLLGLLWLALTVAARLERAAAARAPAEDGVSSPAVRAGPVEVAGPGAAELEPGALAAVAIAVVAHAQTRRRQAAPETRSVQPGSLLHASRWISNGRATQTRGWTRGR